MKRQKLIGLFAACACAAIAGVGVMGINTAAAAGQAVAGVDVSSFRMAYGASVRFKAKDGKNGIRFEATMSKTKYEELEKLENNTEKTVQVNYGMLIVPYDMVKTNALTPENVFSAGGVYCVEDSETCKCGKTHIASVTYEKLSDTVTTDTVVNLRGSLVDILESNLTREFVGAGYIEYVVDGVSSYVMAANALDEAGTEGSESLANNTRSMTYVAQLAIEDNADDSNNTLQTSYVTPLLKREYPYTVNHYLPDGEGGYQAAKTETLYGKLGDQVAASNIAKSSIKNEADYKEYATYGFDTNVAGANVSSTLYANGRTQLNCYYVERDTMLFDATNPNDVSFMAEKYGATADSETATDAGYYYETLADGYTDKNGTTKTNVMKLEMNKAGLTSWGAGYFTLPLDEAKYNEATDANWDYITFRMCVTVEKASFTKTAINMFSTNVYLGSLPLNEWVEFTVAKSTLNNFGSALLDSSAEARMDKTAFDKAFKERTVTNPEVFFYTNDDALKGFAVSNLPTTATVDGAPIVTYYIENIEWGVDCTAPEIVSVNKAVEGIPYIPEVTVKDDIVPNTEYNKKTTGPVVTKELYVEDENGVRKPLTPAADGSYTLEKDGKYILAVTADDFAVTNLPGNILYQEIAIPVRSATEIVTIDDKYDLSSLSAPDKPVDTSYKNTEGETVSLRDIITPEISYLASYTDANGVTKEGVAQYVSRRAIHANGTSTYKYGAWFYLNLSEVEAQAVWEAFSDDTTTFTLTMTLCIDDSASTKKATMAMKNTMTNSGTTVYYQDNQWITLTFTESDILTASGTSSYFAKKETALKALTGETEFFYLNNLVADATGASMTIYVDSISYSVTANA